MHSHRTGIVGGLLLVGLAGVCILGIPTRANAGCGCQKPPPPPAEVRPRAAYATVPVTLFSPALVVGARYTVTFAAASDGSTASVRAAAVSRRDLADRKTKVQLVVPLPRLSLGPANIVVTGPDPATDEVLFVDDAEFTIIPDPLPVPVQAGNYVIENFQGAVGRDGVLYVALDMSGAIMPRVFEAKAAGYPLRFGSKDIVFYNAQGYLMQLLVANQSSGPAAIPGMFVLPAVDPTIESDQIHYSRHEFATYFLQHEERQPHALDPNDPNWHIDGTPHVDHDHLVLAILGRFADGTSPPPGSTPPFDLALRVYSLFSQGLVGAASVSVSDSARVDSYASASTSSSGTNGDVLTNGTLTVDKNAVVDGNASASQFSLKDSARITGTRAVLKRPQSFMEVIVPAGLVDLGRIRLENASRTIRGPGSFRVERLEVRAGGRLLIDNAAGPVTLYVEDEVNLTDGGRVDVTDPNPEKFAIYAAGSTPLLLTGADSRFTGVVYAPMSDVLVRGTGDFAGSFVGQSVRIRDRARVRYDESLRTR